MDGTPSSDSGAIIILILLGLLSLFTRKKGKRLVPLVIEQGEQFLSILRSGRMPDDAWWLRCFPRELGLERFGGVRYVGVPNELRSIQALVFEGPSHLRWCVCFLHDEAGGTVGLFLTSHTGSPTDHEILGDVLGGKALATYPYST